MRLTSEKFPSRWQKGEKCWQNFFFILLFHGIPSLAIHGRRRVGADGTVAEIPCRIPSEGEKNFAERMLTRCQRFIPHQEFLKRVLRGDEKKSQRYLNVTIPHH